MNGAAEPLEASRTLAGPTVGGDAALSVVVVSPARFANVRRTVHHLRRQTVRERIELVLVAPTIAALDDATPHDLAGFHSVTAVAAGPIVDVDRAAAHGLLRASAPIVGVLEDHAFPEPQWAAAQLAAHHGPWGAVGSAMVNANPGGALSWANLVLAYGAWMHPAPDAEIATLPGHNITWKREALAPFATSLAERLGRGGTLLAALRDAGWTLGIAGTARVHHLNPSTWRATARVRVDAGRLYAAERARRWGVVRRLLFASGSPLIPLVRYARVRHVAFARGRMPATWPMRAGLVAALVFDACGQCLGYLAGAGASRARLCRFELDRLPHLTAADRRALDAVPGDDVATHRWPVAVAAVTAPPVAAAVEPG